MERLMVKGNTGYILRYHVEEPKYLDYLPIVQHMANSVEIAKIRIVAASQKYCSCRGL